MKLSIVTTLYCSSPYIAEFLARSQAAAMEIAGEDYEIVLVNDGSPDDSLDVAVELSRGNPHVSIVDLSRNFGHHRAIMVGLSHARGNHVFLLDSDLEEDPAWLQAFHRHMTLERCDVVYGVQTARKGRWFERTTGTLFYRLFRMLTGISQPDNIVTARLMSRRYVDALLQHRERELNIGGLWLITGFKQSPHGVRKASTSPTTYDISRKFGHLVNAITSFSSLPLVYTFYAGLAISLSAAAFIVWLAFRYFFIATPPSGYTSVIASIWLFSGLIILFMGVQGIYLSKIFIEVKQRPYAIVRHVYSHDVEEERHNA